VNGVLSEDERRVVGAAHQIGLILSSQWPDVAAHLIVQGARGEAVAELAGAPRTASPSLLDQLVSKVQSDLSIPELSIDDAGELVGRLLGQAAAGRTDADEFAVIRELTRLGHQLDYYGGVIGDAYYASEWLDWDHANASEREAGVALEIALRVSEPLNIDLDLLRTLTASAAH
jgi:hypothetical protein